MVRICSWATRSSLRRRGFICLTSYHSLIFPQMTWRAVSNWESAFNWSEESTARFRKRTKEPICMESRWMSIMCSIYLDAVSLRCSRKPLPRFLLPTCPRGTPVKPLLTSWVCLVVFPVFFLFGQKPFKRWQRIDMLCSCPVHLYVNWRRHCPFGYISKTQVGSLAQVGNKCRETTANNVIYVIYVLHHWPHSPSHFFRQCRVSTAKWIQESCLWKGG